MITTFYPPYHFGGDGVFIYRLSNELAQRGHRVDVIHSLDAYYSLHPNEPNGQFPNHPNVTVHGLKSRVGILSSFLTQQMGFPYFKKNIQGIIENGEFDIIHFHNISLIGGPKVLEYGNAIKLYTTHEYWLVCPTHVLFKYNREACTKPFCFACSIIHKRPPQLWRYSGMLERAVRHVDAFITPSRFSAEMHRKMRLEIPIVHIPSFVPKPIEAVNKAEILNRLVNPERSYFLFVGRLEKLKGLQDVIPIFREYNHADLLIAGTGEYQEELQELAKGNPRIKFLGTLPYSDLTVLYESAIAVLVPSLCYETFGLIIAEAFTMKTPVIVKNIGALSELVTESDGGFLYQEDSQLIRIMEKLRTDANLRNELGERGYAAYLKYWTEDHYFDKYFRLILDIENKKHSITSQE
jgi:glycosyltransferase involved in cell wall biosynthesis